MKQYDRFCFINSVILGLGLVALSLTGCKPVASPEPSVSPVVQASTNPSGSLTPSAVPSPKASKANETIQTDAKTSKYVDYEHGFAIIYPTYNQEPSDCAQLQAQTFGAVPLKTFVDQPENIVYVASQTILKWQDKKTIFGLQADPATCQVVPNSLDLLKNGYIVMSGSTQKRYPASIKFHFDKVSNDADLSTFAKVFHPGCFAGDKTLVKKTTDTYQVKLVDQAGITTNPDSGCFTNFAYMFYYSPQTQTAIISNAYQEPPFNGSNGQIEPGVELLK